MDPDYNGSDGSQQQAAGGRQQDDNLDSQTLMSRQRQLLATLPRDSARYRRTLNEINKLQDDYEWPQSIEPWKFHCPPDVPQTPSQRLSYSTKKALSKIGLAKKPSKAKSSIRDYYNKVHEVYSDAFNNRENQDVSQDDARDRRDYLQQRVDDLDKLHFDRPRNASLYDPGLGYDVMRSGLLRRQQEEDWRLPDSTLRQELTHEGTDEAPYRELFVQDGIRILMARLDPDSHEYKKAKKLLKNFQEDKLQPRCTPALHVVIRDPKMQDFQNKLMVFYRDAYHNYDEEPMTESCAAKIERHHLDNVLQELETVNANGPPGSSDYPLEYSFKRLHKALQRRVMEVEYRIPGGNIYRDPRTNAFILLKHKGNMKQGVAASVHLDPIGFKASTPTHPMGHYSPGWDEPGIFQFPGNPEEIYAGYTKQNEKDVYLLLLREYLQDFENTCELTTPEEVEKKIQYLETRKRQVEAMLGNLPDNAAEYDEDIGTNPTEIIGRYNKALAELDCR